jgi:hypothetical protein
MCFLSGDAALRIAENERYSMIWLSGEPRYFSVIRGIRRFYPNVWVNYECLRSIAVYDYPC